MEDLPERIGPYTVVSLLGRGTFAEVFRVRANNGNEYALKRNITDDASHHERLLNEADVLQQLAHPGIPGFIASDSSPSPYIVMKLAPGHTVDSTIRQKASLGGVYGDIEALQVAAGLLDVLVHLESKGVVHRDIKAANCVSTASASSVTLIDFGFAKTHGSRGIRIADSFFRAGAVRYSPPAKVANPGLAHSSHDVFAVGVLTYRMLTGAYPWSVEPTGDLGEYREHLETDTPRELWERNPFVRPEISTLVMSLLRTADRHRPTAEQALSTANELLEGTGGGVARPRPSRVSYPHVSRDPLYGDIRLTQMEWEVLHAPEMQRLRHIKQLGLTHYAYLGAEHSRLSHAVGSLSRVEQILGTIEAIEGIAVELETRLTARLYALIHDVTHVAFGHTVEDELGLFDSHDANLPRLHRLLLGSESKLGQVLRQDEIGRGVLAHFDPEATVLQRTGVPELVTGSAGADVLDYVDRDAYHCGLDHRVDSALFRQFRWYRSDDREEPRFISLLYGSEGLRVDREFAVESLLLERYAMFLKVYTHKTKTAASALLGKALTAALVTTGRRRADVTESQYEQLADSEVVSRLTSSRKQLPQELGKELQQGVLPRAVYRAQLLAPSSRSRSAYDTRRDQLASMGLLSPGARADLEAEMARAANVDPAEAIIYCPMRAPGYQRVRHNVAESGRQPHELDSTSPTYSSVEAKHLGLWEVWAFSRAKSRNHDADVADRVESLLALPNLLHQDRRSGRLW